MCIFNTWIEVIKPSVKCHLTNDKKVFINAILVKKYTSPKLLPVTCTV